MTSGASAKPQRRWRWPLALVLICAAVVLFLSIVPTMRYVPGCGSFRSVQLEGPMREQYMLLLMRAFEEDNIFYFRYADDIFVRFFDFFDGDDRFGRHNILINSEGKIATSVAAGVEIEGGYFPPPEPVIEAIEATNPIYGLFMSYDPEGRLFRGPDLRFEDDCELMRVAVIKV